MDKEWHEQQGDIFLQKAHEGADIGPANSGGRIKALRRGSIKAASAQRR
jgi:hypothetical protein